MRTLTSPASTQAALKAGAAPIYILEVEFDSGTVYWSGRNLSSPVTAQGRVISWGDLTLQADPGQAGSVSDMKITVEDSDHAIKQEAESQPGFQKVNATLYLYFEGTTWPDDRVTLFAGVLTAPAEWSEDTAAYTLTMKDRGHKYDENIGVIMSQSIFPEIDCKACENELLPIVYGNPCARVPCCVIDRPGVAQLASSLTSLPPSSSLTIDQGAAEAFFTVGQTLELIVGWGGRWERITGSFSSSDDTTFSITSRGSILASGTIGTYAAGGMTYVTIPTADLSDGGASSRAGNPLLLQLQDNSWTAVMVTHWSQSGTAIIVCVRGSDMDVIQGSSYQLLSEPGIIPVWPAGTQVTEAAISGTSVGGGDWTYIVNALPSKSIDSIEVRARLNVSGGDSHVKWAVVNPAYYNVDLDNRSYNTLLGRSGGDPGVTTVTLDYAPQALGMDDETIYATVKGITDDNTSSGTVLEDPADVVENLLTNEFIGGLSSSLIHSASFAAAASSIVTKCAFAILNEKQKLMEIVAGIAHQANSLLFWDGGQLFLKYLDQEIAAGDSVYTINNSNRAARSLRIAEVDVKEFITELTGKFRRTIVDDDQRIIRGSPVISGTSDASSAGGNAGQTDFGLQRDEIDFWAYQFPSSVAKATELWLYYYLHANRTATVGLFLDALALQPGDVVLFDIDDGNGVAVLDTPARIRKLTMSLGNARTRQMPRIEAVTEIQLYDYAVTVSVPSDDNCAGQNVSGGRSRSQRLELRSLGENRSLHVVDQLRPSYGLGGAGGTIADDPTDNGIISETRPKMGQYETPADASSFS